MVHGCLPSSSPLILLTRQTQKSLEGSSVSRYPGYSQKYSGQDNSNLKKWKLDPKPQNLNPHTLNWGHAAGVATAARAPPVTHVAELHAASRIADDQRNLHFPKALQHKPHNPQAEAVAKGS